MSSPSMCPYLLISYMLSHIFPDHFYVAAMCDLSAFTRGTVIPLLKYMLFPVYTGSSKTLYSQAATEVLQPG